MFPPFRSAVTADRFAQGSDDFQLSWAGVVARSGMINTFELALGGGESNSASACFVIPWKHTTCGIAIDRCASYD